MKPQTAGNEAPVNSQSCPSPHQSLPRPLASRRCSLLLFLLCRCSSCRDWERNWERNWEQLQPGPDCRRSLASLDEVEMKPSKGGPDPCRFVFARFVSRSHLVVVSESSSNWGSLVMVVKTEMVEEESGGEQEPFQNVANSRPPAPLPPWPPALLAFAEKAILGPLLGVAQLTPWPSRDILNQPASPSVFEKQKKQPSKMNVAKKLVRCAEQRSFSTLT